jgi:phage recombination protein Bet
MGQELVKTKTGKTSLLAKMAEKASLDPAVFYDTITKTVFKEAKTKEQVVALLMVADQYGLNPVTKEIFAFPDKGGGVVPVVGADGWNRIAQQHPMFDGVEYRWAEKMVVPKGGKACPEWCEIIVYRKDRAHPTIIREYLDECFRGTGPWQSHTKRMLRHKATIQGYRAAFGFAGIYDEDEAQRLAIEPREAAPAPSTSAEKARQILKGTPTTPEPAEEPEEAPVAAEEVVEVEGHSVVAETGEVVEDAEWAEADEAPPVEEPAESPVEEEPVEVPLAERILSGAEREVQKVTKTQLKAIETAKKKGGWTEDLYREVLARYDAKSATELTRDQALEVVRYLLAGVADDEEA